MYMFRVGNDEAVNVLDFHEFGDIRFFTDGTISSQQEKNENNTKR